MPPAAAAVAGFLPERGGICPACIRKIDTLLRLLSYLLPYFKMAIALVVLTLASTLLDLAPPLIIRKIIDDVLTPHGEVGLLFPFAGALLGISILAWFAGVGRRWLNNSVGCRAAADLRMDLYRALQFLPLRFHEKRKVGSLVSRMTNDAELVEDYLSFDLPFVLSNGLLFVGILILLFVMNWQLACLVVLPIPIIVMVGSLLWAPPREHLAPMVRALVTPRLSSQRIDQGHPNGQSIHPREIRSPPL